MAIIALAGNPNAGKSTLFNGLTGGHQHVGNWPGKTVEKKEGTLEVDGQKHTLVDLPGTYSLTAYSVEEIITRDFIVQEHPQAVVAVVDATNIERNLYLVLQLLEMGTPLIVALNMFDMAEKRHIKLNIKQLSDALGGIPVIPTVGHRQIGLDDLRRAIGSIDAQPDKAAITAFPDEIESEILALAAVVQQSDGVQDGESARWVAIKLLEADSAMRERYAHNTNILQHADQAMARIEATHGDTAEILIVEARYERIGGWLEQALGTPIQNETTASEQIDAILTHRILGLPIFFLFMWFVFQFTANVSAPMLDWIDGTISGPLSNQTAQLMATLSLSDTWLAALLIDGVIAGVGGVLVFVPVLMSLYLAIAVLEDSGYMARAAFVMDRAMRGWGLHGKSFLPMLVGFGCTVPAVYATRTLENEADRKITAFLATFMSCGARLPVYIIFGAVFFRGSGTFIFSLYLLGIAIALLTSVVLTRVAYRNKPPTHFVMELPPYRVPNLNTIWKSTWHRTASFVRKAGTVILAASIIIWLLLAIPVQGDGEFNDVETENSAFGTVSQVSAPLLEPAGFGDWRASGSLITGFVAKEIVIATMAQVYDVEEPAADEPVPTLSKDVETSVVSFGEAIVLTGQEMVNIVPRTVNLVPMVNMPELSVFGGGEDVDETGLRTALDGAFSPLAALAFCVFVLLYVPCMAATAAMRHEFGTRWMIMQAAYTIVIAWFGAVLVYQIGSLLGY